MPAAPIERIPVGANLEGSGKSHGQASGTAQFRVPASLKLPRLGRKAQRDLLERVDAAEDERYSLSRLSRSALLLNASGYAHGFHPTLLSHPATFRRWLNQGWSTYASHISPTDDRSAQWRLSLKAYDYQRLAAWLLELLDLGVPSADCLAKGLLTDPTAPVKVMSFVTAFLNGYVSGKHFDQAQWGEIKPCFSIEGNDLYWDQEFVAYTLYGLSHCQPAVEESVRAALKHLSCELRPLGLPHDFLEMSEYMLSEAECEVEDIERKIEDAGRDCSDPEALDAYFAASDSVCWCVDSAESYHYYRHLITAKKQVELLWEAPEFASAEDLHLSEHDQRIMQWVQKARSVTRKTPPGFEWPWRLSEFTPVLPPEMAEFEASVQQQYEHYMDSAEDNREPLEPCSLASLKAAIDDAYQTVVLLNELHELIHP